MRCEEDSRDAAAAVGSCFERGETEEEDEEAEPALPRENPRMMAAITRRTRHVPSARFLCLAPALAAAMEEAAAEEEEEDVAAAMRLSTSPIEERSVRRSSGQSS